MALAVFFFLLLSRSARQWERGVVGCGLYISIKHPQDDQC